MSATGRPVHALFLADGDAEPAKGAEFGVRFVPVATDDETEERLREGTFDCMVVRADDAADVTEFAGRVADVAPGLPVLWSEPDADGAETCRRVRAVSDGSLPGARRALERVSEAVWTVDEDWRVTIWNRQVVELTDVPAASALGTPLQHVLPEAVGDELEATLEDAMATGEERTVDVEWPTDGTPVECHVYPEGDGIEIHVRVRDALRPADEAAERPTGIGGRPDDWLAVVVDAMPLSVVALDDGGTVTLWNGAAEETFGWTADEAVGRYHPIVPEGSREAFEANLQQALTGEPIRGREVTRVTKDGRELELRLSTAPFTYDDAEENSRTEVIAILEDVTERKRRERQLRALQEVSNSLNLASSTEEVAREAVTAAVDVLDLELTAVWRYDADRDALVPLAGSPDTEEAFGGPPVFPAGSGLAWEAFESGEYRIYSHVHEAERRYNAETPVRSELIAPLGEQGVMITGSLTERSFDEATVDMFRTLAAAVEAALVRSDREARLERQNERLDRFADVVAHDLRNPLSVAEGFLELAEETGDPEHFGRVQGALDRMDGLVGELLTLARNADDEPSEPVELDEVVRQAWAHVDTRDAVLEHESLPEIEGNRNRLTQLFENCFGNSVEHGGNDVTIRVRPLEDGGFYMEDDGVGIPPDHYDRVFENRFTTRENGTGFGLAIVAEIAEAHGWTVEAGEGADGGARLEFRPL
ncbi:PAS domain S-box protein [Halorarum halophilum]|uniref:histidine kinase n=1 Tax=Halorarum halophilum TaxID=2743090 RepID=A0A7D5KU73_9EURY|nr:PAS domain S-box protein [Halobaculum halophilum]QLG27080.1 PAS domain S-box protein [Halobaculum halophilum]